MEPINTANNTANNTGITSTTSLWNTFNDASLRLNQFNAGTDRYAQLFNQMSGLNQGAYNVAVANVATDKARQQQATEQVQNRYLAGLETASISSGTSRYASEFQKGLMASAENTFLDRFQQIDRQAQLAYLEAEQARAQGDVSLLTKQLDYLQQLQKEKNKALQDAISFDWEQSKFGQQMAWDKQKFGQQMALSWAQENRLRSAQEFSQSQKLLELDDLEVLDEDGEISERTVNMIMNDYSKEGLFNFALNHGIKRNRLDFSKKPEIRAIFDDVDLGGKLIQALSAGAIITPDGQVMIQNMQGEMEPIIFK